MGSHKTDHSFRYTYRYPSSHAEDRKRRFRWRHERRWARQRKARFPYVCGAVVAFALVLTWVYA